MCMVFNWEIHCVRRGRGRRRRCHDLRHTIQEEEEATSCCRLLPSHRNRPNLSWNERIRQRDFMQRRVTRVRPWRILAVGLGLGKLHTRDAPGDLLPEGSLEGGLPERGVHLGADLEQRQRLLPRPPVAAGRPVALAVVVNDEAAAGGSRAADLVDLLLLWLRRRAAADGRGLLARRGGRPRGRREWRRHGRLLHAGLSGAWNQRRNLSPSRRPAGAGSIFSLALASYSRLGCCYGRIIEAERRRWAGLVELARMEVTSASGGVVW